VQVDVTPTVTLEGDIRLDLTVISSTRKADVLVAGQLIPSFGNREVTTRLRLRDGESNLLAGLLQDSEQVGVTGFPGAIHLPILKQLFSSNTGQYDQTDIVMLLTPHIVRTHEINENDLKPIYIGSQQNLGVGGPPPLIAAQPEAPPPVVAPVPAPAPVPLRVPGAPTVTAPPGSSPVPGTVLVQPTPLPAPTPPVTVPPEPPAPPAATPAGTPPAVPVPPATTPPVASPVPPEPPAVPTASPGVGAAQVTMTPPAPTLRVGGGPYTLPISIANATRLSTITLTLIYDPLKLRIRTVQEGGFMRSGGGSTSFSQQVSGNRIDITITRAGDVTGATGTGLLAAILFDAVEAGATTLTLSGTATGPGGVAMGLRFAPVTITLQ
jgi:general secretion pathway protein D